MKDKLLLLFIMRESGVTVNDTPNIHFTDPTSNDHCISFAKSELKMPLHINGTFSLFHTRKATVNEILSFEKIFITPDLQHWNPYFTSYGINDRSMLK